MTVYVDDMRAKYGRFIMCHARPCFKCGRKITACFGFCKAGDLVEILEGRRTIIPRELCGLCVEFWQWNADSELEPNPLPFDGFLERVEQ